MASATVTSKGQVTIPKTVREHLGIDTGDRLDFLALADGSVRLTARQGPIGDLAGLLRREGAGAVRLEDLDAAIRESVALEDERIRRGR